MKYSWIIFVLIVAWQVVAGIVQSAAKKQQQARMADLAAQRRGQQGSQTGTAGRTQSAAGPAGGGEPGGATRTFAEPGADPRTARAQDLAARRKAQLDELRRRRVVPPATAEISPTSSAPPTPARAASRPRKEIATLSATRASVHESREASRKEKLAQKQRAVADSAAVHRQLERDFQKDQARRQAAASAAKKRRAKRADEMPAGRVSSAEYEHDTPGRRPRPKHRAIALLDNPATLRDLFVLKEILDGPLSERQRQGIHGVSW